MPDGSLYTWGGNAYGQLGNGTKENSSVPVKVMDNVTSVSAGYLHTAALTSSGELYVWGDNRYGQLGNGDEGENAYFLVPLKIMDDVVAVSAGAWHTAAIKSDGSLWIWGYNKNGQLGSGKIGENSNIPLKVLDDVVAVSAGSSHTTAITSDAVLWDWGNYITLCRHAKPDIDTPLEIYDNSIEVSAGGAYTAAIRSDASLWTWGVNEFGRLGYNKDVCTKYQHYTPFYSDSITKIMENVTAVSAGECHAAAIQSDGSLWTWGRNDYGQLGVKIIYDWKHGYDITNFNSTDTPCRVPDLENVVAVSAGLYHTVAVTSDGSIWTWGYGYSGQLGNGKTENSDTPVKVLFPYLPSTDGWGFQHATACANSKTISEKVWYAIYDKSKWQNQKNYLLHSGGAEHGLCQGMAVTSALVYSGYPSADAWSENAQNASMLTAGFLNNPSKSFGWTIAEYMQGIWAYQFSADAAKETKAHKKELKARNYQTIVDKTNQFHDTGENPIAIIIRDWFPGGGKPSKMEGHVLIPYKTEKTDVTLKVYVYDCSYQNDDGRYILFGYHHGVLDNWYYEIQPEDKDSPRVVFSSETGSMSYLDNLSEQAALMNITKTVSTAPMLYSSADNFSVSTKSGHTVSVKQGRVTGDEETGLIPMETAGVLLGSDDLRKSDPVVFYLEDESLLSVVNDAEKAVETVIVNDTADIAVTSGSHSSVTVGMDAKRYTVQVAPDNDKAVSISYTVNNGETVISASGTANGIAALSAETGEENAEISGFHSAVVTVTKDGKNRSFSIGNGSHHVSADQDGSASSVSIESVSVQDDTVSVSLNGSMAEEGVLFVAAYNKNGKMLSIASESVHIENAFSGPFSVRMETANANSIAAFLLSTDMKPLCGKNTVNMSG
ncbi:MAG: hypothetical protein IJR54_03320 [Oscillibacter sp.]|nr:hypothetical protein [Oscillibacter sp.]